MLTVAIPTVRPELVNSVICCGSSAPPGFLVRSYQPKFFSAPKSFWKPAMPVDSARSAEQHRNSGRPMRSRASELTHDPKVENVFLFATEVPGATNSSAGSLSGASHDV